MKIDLTNELLNALKKHGAAENICFDSDLTGNWSKYASTDTMKTDIPSDVDLRHKLINQGRILEENANKHYYCWLIQIQGLFAPEVLLITILDGSTIHMAAYAKEGILSKGTAAKAIAQVKEALSK